MEEIQNEPNNAHTYEDFLLRISISSIYSRLWHNQVCCIKTTPFCKMYIQSLYCHCVATDGGNPEWTQQRTHIRRLLVGNQYFFAVLATSLSQPIHRNRTTPYLHPYQRPAYHSLRWRKTSCQRRHPRTLPLTLHCPSLNGRATYKHLGLALRICFMPLKMKPFLGVTLRPKSDLYGAYQRDLCQMLGPVEQCKCWKMTHWLNKIVCIKRYVTTSTSIRAIKLEITG